MLETPILFKANRVAIILFNLWQEQAEKHYSGCVFQVKDNVVANDLIVAFAKSLELIFRNENQEKRNNLEWAIEYILNSASTILSICWSQEYIFNQTQPYKELCYLKAIGQYLKLDAIAIKKIEALYKNIMSKNRVATEEANSTTEKNEKIVDLNQFKKDRNTNATFKKKVIDYLESNYFEKHFLALSETLKYKPTIILSNFFSVDEIHELIRKVRHFKK